MLGKLPSELDIDDIDPAEMAWMQHSWAEDYGDNWKLLEQNALLSASFMNPEGVQKHLGNSGETHSSGEEGFEKASEFVSQLAEQDKKDQELTIKRRKRRKIASTNEQR